MKAGLANKQRKNQKRNSIQQGSFIQKKRANALKKQRAALSPELSPRSFKGPSARKLVKNKLEHETCIEKLRKKIFGGGLDPYVVFTLCRKKRDEPYRDVFCHRTKPFMGGGSNIFFHEKHHNRIDWKIDEPWVKGEKMVLKVVCWEKDVVSADDLIGMKKKEVTGSFECGKKKYYNFALEFGEENAGLIEISIEYKRETKHVIIEVVAAADLKLPEEEKNIEGGGFGAGTAVAFFFVYVGVALVYFSYNENWSYVDTIYFLFICLTTVGYGDHKVPFISKTSYIMTSVFIILGFAVGAMSVSVLIQYMVDKMEAEKEGMFQNVDAINNMDMGDDMGDDIEVSDKKDTSEEEHIQKKPNIFVAYLKKAPSSLWAAIFVGCVGIVGTMFTDAITPPGEDVGRNLEFKEALYFVTVTMSTIGFGDYTPTRGFWQLALILWIGSGTVFMAKLVGDIMDMQATARAEKKYMQRFTTAFQSRKDIALFDEDGDGEISELEFVVKMLSRLKLCKESDVADIRRVFREMDADGGGSVDIEEMSVFLMGLQKKIERAEEKRKRHSLVGHLS